MWVSAAMIKWCLLLSVVCLHFSTYLSPSHKSATHAAVSLPPPPPPGRSVHPLCLTPLAFIRTVDGESRSLQKAYTQMGGVGALPYVRAKRVLRLQTVGNSRQKETHSPETQSREVKRQVRVKVRSVAPHSLVRWASTKHPLRMCLWRPSLCH